MGRRRSTCRWCCYGKPSDDRQNHVVKDFKDTRQIYPKPDDMCYQICCLRTYFEVYDRYAEECPVPPEDYPFLEIIVSYTITKERIFFQTSGTSMFTRVFGIVIY